MAADADALPEVKGKGSQANLSDLVKEIVKEMDGDEFYSKPEMYDESAEEHWFNIDITLERDGGQGMGDRPPAVVRAASLRKPWSEFLRLHYLLLTDEFGCDEAVKEQLPALPAGPPRPTSDGVAGVSSSSGGGGGGGGGGGTSSNESSCNGSIDANSSSSSAEIARRLDAYLKALLAIPAVVQSQVFSGFLEKKSSGQRRADRGEEQEEERRRAGSAAGRRDGCSGWDGGGGGGAGGGQPHKSPETAIDFLLQPFEYSKVYLPRRAQHTESIDVLRGESVVWKFEVMDHLDIDFSVTFRPQPVGAGSPFSPPDGAGDGDQFPGEAGGAAVAVAPDASPGPRGAGGETSAAANNGRRSSEGEGKLSRWWGRGDGGAGCKSASFKSSVEAGAASDVATGGGGGEGVAKEDKEQTVHLPTRYSTGGGDPVQGSFSCPAAGTCILRWDNSFSRLRGKRLCFVFESATIPTMRAAIEAAGAIDHKRRATRSTAAQTILDSGHGEVKVSVTAVAAADESEGDEEEKRGGEKGDAGARSAGGGSDGSGSPGSAIGSGTAYYGGYYGFGRVRRVVADLLRDLGGIVDARKTGGASAGSGGSGEGFSDAAAGGGSMGGTGGVYGDVDAEGVERLVKQFELLEDELASVSARRAQSEAQGKVLLATLQKANTRVDRLERNLEDVREDLSTTRASLGETETARDEATAAAAEASARLQTSEEQLLRSRREHDLLQAERSVWQVARSGIQEELAKVVAELELERHRHEDTSRALAKSHESRVHAEAEAARLNRRLEEERGGAGGARAALAAEREVARLAREEAEDARTAVAELDAVVAELGAQKRVLVAGLRNRERALGDRCASAEARAEEAAMMRRAAEARVRELEEEAERREAAQADGEIRLQRLRAEKRVLLAEVRRGAGAGGAGGAMAVSPGGGFGERREDGGRDAGVEGVRGREGVGGGSGRSNRKSSFSPRSSAETVQDNKATLKQLSRQLVHLRERQHHLREDLRADPSNTSALRLEADVDRAVQNLETRIRRLLSVVAVMRHFEVLLGATLELDGLSLVGGYSDSYGRGVLLWGFGSSFDATSLDIVDCSFVGNTADSGGATLSNTGTGTFAGTSSFANNSATRFGGATDSNSGTTTITGSSSFANNFLACSGDNDRGPGRYTGLNSSNARVEREHQAVQQSRAKLGQVYPTMKPAYVTGSGILLAFLALAKSQTLPACDVGVTTLVVSSTADVVDLSEALLSCAGGQFEVTWVGEVLITSTIVVPGGTSLKVTGSSFGQGVVYGGGQVRLFEVSPSSALELDFLSLVGGYAHGSDGSVYAAGGGAVALLGDLFGPSSDTAVSVDIVDCAFVGNTANNSNGGAIFAEAGTITISGNSTFEDNSAISADTRDGRDGHGGAIGSNGGTVSIDGHTNFISNSADDQGGAIWVVDSKSLAIRGESIFADNFAEDGGAIFVVSLGLFGLQTTIFTIDDASTFANNTAESNGGALYILSADVTIGGATTFENNMARDGSGGAIYCGDASFGPEGEPYVGFTLEGEAYFGYNTAGRNGGAFDIGYTGTIGGVTTFENNTARDGSGGAIHVSSGFLTVEGEAYFGYNSAGRYGGAIGAYLDELLGDSPDNLTVHGLVDWTGNRAGLDGGALYCAGLSDWIINPINASFTSNFAEGNGGAVGAASGASVSFSGPVSFHQNTAQSNGGAIAVFDAVITAEEGPTFTNNIAVTGAGGGIYCSAAVASFNGSVFTANEAVWGGGLALFSTGSAWNEAEPVKSGPANTTNCVFDRNNATDGGAIYSAAGYDIVQDCWFEANVAAGSGGAYLHSGVNVDLERCTFVENQAGEEGPAVLSLGIAENVSEVVFDSNTFYCSSGTYGYEMASSDPEVSGTCRFDVVCSRCALSCEDTPTSVNVLDDTVVPTCQPIMTGVQGGTPGLTLRTLELKRGYYRTSSVSKEVLECYQEDACVGGNDASEYCALGYRDAYCAVCEEGYGSGYQYRCSSCVGRDKRSAVATAAAVLVMAVIFIGLVITDLVRVMDEEASNAISCNKRVFSCRDRIVKAVPLTAIKIILVSWQIVTQFTSVVDVVYPEVYENFLSVVNLVNFDIGLILSVSCVVDTNFYGRLVFATIAPLAVLGALGLTYAIARSRNRHSLAGLRAARGKHLSVALFTIFVVYSSVSFVLFQTFVCETLDNGVEYLRADYSLTCSTITHTAWKAYAGLMIFVYPIGVPAVLAWWLISNRSDLVKVGSENSSGWVRLQPMRDLFEPYKPHRYYYEVVEFGRRILLTGVGVFLFPGSSAQVALEVVFAAVFIAISEMLSPFANPMDAWLYRSGAWVVFFSMYLGLLLKVDASDEDSQSQQVFAKILIAANVGLVLAVVVQAVVSVRQGLVSMRDLPIANHSSRSVSFAQICDGEVANDDERDSVAARHKETARPFGALGLLRQRDNDDDITSPPASGGRRNARRVAKRAPVRAPLVGPLLTGAWRSLMLLEGRCEGSWVGKASAHVLAGALASSHSVVSGLVVGLAVWASCAKRLTGSEDDWKLVARLTLEVAVLWHCHALPHGLGAGRPLRGNFGTGNAGDLLGACWHFVGQGAFIRLVAASGRLVRLNVLEANALLLGLSHLGNMVAGSRMRRVVGAAAQAHTYQLRGFFSRRNGIFGRHRVLSLPFDSADTFLALQAKLFGILSATEREVVQKNGALASAFRDFAAQSANTLDAHSLGAVGARNLMGMGFIAARVRTFGRPALSLGWTAKANNMCMVGDPICGSLLQKLLDPTCVMLKGRGHVYDAYVARVGCLANQ
eukprot:g6891.t2